MKKINAKKVGAIALGLGIIAGTAFGALAIPRTIETPFMVENKTVKYVDVFHNNTITINATEEQLTEAFTNGINSVEPIIVTDKELIQATCDRLLFDDIAECQEEVLAEDEALKLALEYVESQDFFDELEDANIVRDEDKVSHINTYSDFDEIVVVKSRFKDDFYKFDIEVKVEDDKEDEKVKVLATIVVEDGEVEFKTVSEI